jgi:HEAT repeat protein
MAKLHILIFAILFSVGAERRLAVGEPQSTAGAAAPSNSTLDVPRLRELLNSRQRPLEQSQAALRLLDNQSGEAANVVLAGLQRWDRPDVFQALAVAVGLRRDRRFQASLVKALASEQPAIRDAAVETLARLESAPLVHQLLTVAQDVTALEAARQSAAAALGKCVHKSAAVALLCLLASEAPAVRQSAASALEEMTGEHFGADGTRWQQWWQRYKDMPDEEWLLLRAGYFADRARRLREDLRQAESNILGLQQTLYAKLPPGDRLAHLKKLANNEYPDVRGQAVLWIGEALPDQESAQQKMLVELLLRLSDDVAESVQRQAVLALEKADDPRAFERLLSLVETGSDSVRAAAARSLGRYRSNSKSETASAKSEMTARVVAALEKAIGDPSVLVVRDAAESLGSLGVPAVAPLLAGLLRHPSAIVREAAAHALEQMSNPAVLTSLCDVLAAPDTSDNVRFSMVGALGKIGKEGRPTDRQKAELLKRLQTVLARDPDPGVRSRAATVLGDLGGPADLTLLWQRVTTNEDNRVQLKAWEAMIEILARSLDWGVVSSWDKILADSQQHARRAALLSELRNRWLKVEAAKPHLDALNGALIQALLMQLKWQQAMPLALELAKRSQNPAELEARLRWLLLAGKQALDEHKPLEVLQMITDIQDLLPQAPNALGSEFDALRRRAALPAEKSDSK